MDKAAPPPQRMDRRAAVPALIGAHTDFLIVAGLAGTARDVAAMTNEAPSAFLFGGAMGGAAMTGLGLALAQPDRSVLVVTGDGDLLMSLGALATIAVVRPGNLGIVCVDNEQYGETGAQDTHTARGVDLAAVAAGCGFTTMTVQDEGGLAAASGFLRQAEGPRFVLLKVAPGPPADYKRNWHAEEGKTAFRRALLGKR